MKPKGSRRIAALAASTMLSIWLAFPTIAAAPPPTLTPIKHIVVIFQENVSFDHYFASYPNAANPRVSPASPRATTRRGLTD